MPRTLLHTALTLATLVLGSAALAQSPPNPYRLVDGWAKLNGGRQIGAVGDVDVAPDGKHIWAILRCDAGGDKFTYECLDSSLDTVFEFDADGNQVASFGGGLFIWPHGLDVDRDGNVWVTDAASTERTDGPSGRGRGHQVVKFSPDGSGADAARHCRANPATTRSTSMRRATSWSQRTATSSSPTATGTTRTTAS